VRYPVGTSCSRFHLPQMIETEAPDGMRERITLKKWLQFSQYFLYLHPIKETPFILRFRDGERTSCLVIIREKSFFLEILGGEC
jgi:hypothetical protein